MQKKRRINFIFFAAVLLFCGCIPMFSACKGKTLIGIEIVTPPEKTNYVAGQTFDSSGMTVRALFSDGSQENITDYTWSPVGGFSITANRAMIFYRGQTARQPISVVARAPASIAILTPPDKTAYLYGEIFDPSGMTVCATFNDGSQSVVEDYTFDCTPLTEESGNQVMISYGGRTTAQPVTMQNGFVAETEDSVIFSAGARIGTEELVKASGNAYVTDFAPNDSVSWSFEAVQPSQAMLVLRASGVNVPQGAVAQDQPTDMIPTQLNQVADILVNGVPVVIPDTAILSGAETPRPGGDMQLWFLWTEFAFPINVQPGKNEVELLFKNSGIKNHYGSTVTANVDCFQIYFSGETGGILANPVSYRAEFDDAYVPASKGIPVIFWGEMNPLNVSERYNRYGLPQEYDPAPELQMTYGGVRDFVSLSHRAVRMPSKTGKSIENIGSQKNNPSAFGSNTIVFTVFAQKDGGADIELQLACAFGDAKNPARAGNDNAPMKSLSRFFDLTVNGLAVDIAGIDLYPRAEAVGVKDNWDNWKFVYVRNVALRAGENLVKIVTKPVSDYANTSYNCHCPNIGSLLYYPHI